MKNLFLFALIALVFSACGKEKDLETVSEVEEIQQFQLKSGTTAITTLEDLQNTGEGTLEDVPGSYQLEMEGQWNYTEAYLYTNTEGETHEIYVFNDGTDIQAAQVDCDKNYSEKEDEEGNVTICCSGEGNGCKTTLTPAGWVISVCVVG